MKIKYKYEELLNYYDEPTTYSIYGVRSHREIEGGYIEETNEFLIYKDEEWTWVNARDYLPI